MDYSLLRHPAASSSSPFSFLSTLPPLTRRLCLQHASFSSLPAHTQLLHEDEHPRYMYAVLQGSLSLFVRGEEGDELCVGAVRRGESVGAIGMLYGSDDMYSRRYRGEYRDRDSNRNREYSPANEERPIAQLSSAVVQPTASSSNRSSVIRRSSFSPGLSALPPPPVLPSAVALSYQLHRYGVTAITNVQTDVAVFDLSALQLLLSPSTGWQPSFQQLFPFVHRLPLLLPCSHYRLMQLMHVSRLMYFQRGEWLELQGEESDGLHIVVSGEVEIVRELETAGGGKARDVVLGRLGEGELVGDGCVQSEPWLPYVSVRAACRVSTLFISRPLLSALLPRALWKQLRDSHRRRLEHYQQRVAHTLTLIRRHVHVAERAVSARSKSPLLAITEQRNRDDRKEGLRAREHKRTKGDEDVAPALVMSSEAPKASDADDDHEGGMQELHHCFQQLMRGRDGSEGNVTRHFGVRKRWRWAISAVVYLARVGMAFLVRDKDGRDEHDEQTSIDAAFAAYTKKSTVAQPSLLHNRTSRRHSITSTTTTRLSQHGRHSIDTSHVEPPSPRSGSAGRRSSVSSVSSVGGRSHYVHHRSVSINVHELDRLEGKLARVRDEEERERRSEEEKRQIAQRMEQVAEEAEAEERQEEETRQASSTFLTATDDVELAEQFRAPSRSSLSLSRHSLYETAATMDVQRVQPTDEERQYMEAAADRMTEDDTTSLAYMRRHSHRRRHFRASSASLLIKQTAQLAQHRRGSEDEARLQEEERSAQHAFASLWAPTTHRVQPSQSTDMWAPPALSAVPILDEQPTFTAITAPVQRKPAADVPAGECCLRLSALIAADGSGSIRKPARYFPDLFVSLFPASAVSLRSVHFSPASSFYYLHLSSTTLSAAMIHSRLRDALLPTFPSLVSLLVDIASLGSGQLRCLWMRGSGQRVESEKRRGQEAALLATRDELVRQLRAMGWAGRWTSDGLTAHSAEEGMHEETEEKELMTDHSRSKQPTERNEAVLAANRELPPLRSARRPPLQTVAWLSPFARSQQRRSEVKQREQQREAATERRERGEGQGERIDGIRGGPEMALGGGVVRARRPLRGEEVATARFEKQKRRMWRAAALVAEERQRRMGSTVPTVGL